MNGFYWFIFSVAGAFFAAWLSFYDPFRLVGMIDIAATLISILISVSLALMAFLANPFSVSENLSTDPEERGRIDSVLKRDDVDFFDGQLVLFASFFVSLGLLMALKWVTIEMEQQYSVSTQRYLATAAAFFSMFSFLWAARLPSMIRNLARQRRELG